MRFVKGYEVFQQDGAPSHRVLETLAYLDKICVRESSRKVVPWHASGVCVCSEWAPEVHIYRLWITGSREPLRRES